MFLRAYFRASRPTGCETLTCSDLNLRRRSHTRKGFPTDN